MGEWAGNKLSTKPTSAHFRSLPLTSVPTGAVRQLHTNHQLSHHDIPAIRQPILGDSPEFGRAADDSLSVYFLLFTSAAEKQSRRKKRK